MKPFLAATILATTASVSLAQEAPSDWTGPYVGIFTGANFPDFENPESRAEYSDESGPLAGVVAGADFQTANWVFGIAADFAFHDAQQSAIEARPDVDLRARSELQYQATLRARAGYLFTPEALFYLHGGVAFAEVESSIDALFIDGPVTYFNESEDRTGITLGAGVEYRVSGNTSLVGEYAFTDFGSGSSKLAPVDLQTHAVKIGLNYRF